MATERDSTDPELMRRLRADAMAMEAGLQREKGPKSAFEVPGGGTGNTVWPKPSGDRLTAPSTVPTTPNRTALGGIVLGPRSGEIQPVTHVGDTAARFVVGNTGTVDATAPPPAPNDPLTAAQTQPGPRSHVMHEPPQPS